MSIATNDVSDFLDFLEEQMKKSKAKRGQKEKLVGHINEIDNDDGDSFESLEHSPSKESRSVERGPNGRPLNDRRSISSHNDPISFTRIRSEGTNLRSRSIVGRVSSFTKKTPSPTERKGIETLDTRLKNLESKLEAESSLNRELLKTLTSVRDEIGRLRLNETKFKSTLESLHEKETPESARSNVGMYRRKMSKKMKTRKMSKK
jgi:hypothetical protein